MTASPPHPPPTGHMDTTAELMNLIGAELGRGLHRLGRTSPDLRHPADPAAQPPALVAVAHGSRDPRALRTVTALLDRVRRLRPRLPVRLGHIELNAPLLPETLAELQDLHELHELHEPRAPYEPRNLHDPHDARDPRRTAILVPLLLSRGHHVKHDIPQALAAVPQLRGRVAAPLGPHPLLVDALHARLTEAGWRPPVTAAAAARHGVVLAAAGSLDPDSAVDTARTAELLGTRLGGVPVHAAYASAARPTVPEAVARLRARGRDHIAVAAYFTAPGRFAAQSAEQAPGIAAAPLGDHPDLARLVLHRYDEALAARTAPSAAARTPHHRQAPAPAPAPV